MDVFIFKTTISQQGDVNVISRFFISEPYILDWNVDVEDIDNILRTESENLSPETIEQLVKKAGFDCSHLKY